MSHLPVSGARRSWRPLLAFAAGLFAVVAFLGLSSLGDGPGFPLDDGWIHQTYARNLARNGRLEFAPGALSAGSTAPLWTALLAAGYLLRVPPLWWAYTLGILSLFALVWAAMRLWRVLWPAYAHRDWVAGAALALSWPLVWAAGSGMETLLFMALGFALLAQFLDRKAGGAHLGLLGGLLILVRPEGLILTALLGASMILQRQWQRLSRFLGAALVLLFPYFIFNLVVSGVLWPNTFYAKQTEYAVLLERPLLERLLQLLYFSLGGPESGWRGLSGAHLVLLPGLLVAVWRTLCDDWTRRRLWRALPLLWAAGHVTAYALRLPVTYQHGRYLWVALPAWILFGLAGWAYLLGRLQPLGRSGRILTQSAVLTFVVLLLLFLGFGAQAYVQDVAFVQNEMVDVALWLRDNTEPDALVAAHDIGAIGYYARRPLLDLAGLVTPQVIPLLDDEEALARYVRQSDAAYLVTAPGWPYTALVAATDVRLLYDTNYAWTRQEGLNNMAVFALPGASPSGEALPGAGKE